MLTGHFSITFFRLQHKDVFKLIKNHNLYDVIYRTIVPLIQLDSEQAIQMLLERNKIPADVVVAQLQDHEEYLYLVRHASFINNYFKYLNCVSCDIYSDMFLSILTPSIKWTIQVDSIRNWYIYMRNTIEINCCHS